MADHLFVEARANARSQAARGEDGEERAAKRASEELAQRLQREVESFLSGRGGPSKPEA